MAKAIKEDCSGVIARALTLSEEKQSTSRPARKIFDVLLGTDEPAAAPTQIEKFDLKIGNLLVGMLAFDSEGTAKMSLRGLSREHFGQLSSLLVTFCADLKRSGRALEFPAQVIPEVKPA